ncbi:MAG: M23 family metallopeptidase [Candidatus Promineifilaceae bacterium]|nr:M23 family metallopeptidase [Candidatus Promineifilaceae bacterium]
MSFRKRFFPLLLIVVLALLLFVAPQLVELAQNARTGAMLTWFAGSEGERVAMLTVQREPCPGAPFVLPADGFIGLVYADKGGPYSRSRPHQGIDIFSPDRDQGGLVPVYAAYDGYISREGSWRSALIQRIPRDPLSPDRQIWLYYAHMADEQGNSFIAEAFPPGSSEIFVSQGTLLGYTGNYNGASNRSIWVHLHFSLVKDNGQGQYLNELEFENTIDPSPYLGLPLHYDCAPTTPVCGPIDRCGRSG